MSMIVLGFSARAIEYTQSLGGNMTKNSTLLENFMSTYLQLNRSNLELLDKIYRNDIEFTDPLHRIEGLANLKSYFAYMYDNVQSIHFDYESQVCTESEASIQWLMTFRHNKLNRGKPILVNGSSHLRFDDKVYYHRDYFDAGQMLYEHIPLVGRLISFIKKRAQ